MDVYFYFIILLFILAIVDLIVGVSNDAVNFLNSAIGSKVASFKTIFLIASVGIIMGAIFSEGMMQIARNGIFSPSYFTFQQVMIIFLAVMLTDVLLIDFYNTLGLPTSTTVSLIFELLGASFAIGLIIIYAGGNDALRMTQLINHESAVTIISGIFLSVLISFVVGSIVQYFARLLFSFKFEKSVKQFGALFGGLSVTTIVYFLLIKGAKGSALINEAQSVWIEENTWYLLGGSFAAFTLFIAIGMRWFKLHPLKLVVLLGTFALAMAFAGNDLVNFIGVSIAGMGAFQLWVESQQGTDSILMGGLNAATQTPFWILFSAGIIMIITLWTNAKSKKVTETEVSLGSQEDGQEKFTPNMLSRLIVGGAIRIGSVFSLLLPDDLKAKINKRFVRKKKKKGDGEKASFDLVRASINLLVSSALIAYGTANKLPLSTTFVTFMVAMGSSFADQAWGRETAVFRVAGVIRVIGGWVLTSVFAFVGCAIVAIFLYYSFPWGIFVFALIAFVVLIRSHYVFVKKENKDRISLSFTKGHVKSDTQVDIIKVFENVTDILAVCNSSLRNSSVKELKRVKKDLDKYLEESIDSTEAIFRNIQKIDNISSSTARNYLVAFGRLQNIHQSVLLISDVCIEHVSNHHKLPSQKYCDKLASYITEIQSLIKTIQTTVKSQDPFDQSVLDQSAHIAGRIDRHLDKQLQLFREGIIGNRLGFLQMRILLEIKELVQEMVLIASEFKFSASTKEEKNKLQA
jgi:phosphate/sulfate permease